MHHAPPAFSTPHLHSLLTLRTASTSANHLTKIHRRHDGQSVHREAFARERGRGRERGLPTSCQAPTVSTIPNELILSYTNASLVAITTTPSPFLSAPRNNASPLTKMFSPSALSSSKPLALQAGKKDKKSLYACLPSSPISLGCTWIGPTSARLPVRRHKV